MTLEQHIRSMNDKTRAWVAEDPQNRWAGLLVEDAAHWAEMNIHTVAEFERWEMETTIWDLYKDVTGIRPSHMDFKSMSDEQLKKEYDYLLNQMEQQAAYEAEYIERQKEIDAEQEREHLAWLAEQPEPIDYVACLHQEGWL